MGRNVAIGIQDYVRLKGDVLKDLPDKLEEIRYAKLEA